MTASRIDGSIRAWGDTGDWDSVCASPDMATTLRSARPDATRADGRSKVQSHRHATRS